MKKGLLRFISSILVLCLLIDPVTVSAVSGPSVYLPAPSFRMLRLEQPFQEQALVSASRLSGLQVLLPYVPMLYTAFHLPARQMALGSNMGLTLLFGVLMAWTIPPSAGSGQPSVSTARLESLPAFLRTRFNKSDIHFVDLNAVTPEFTRQMVDLLRSHFGAIRATTIEKHRINRITQWTPRLVVSNLARSLGMIYPWQARDAIDNQSQDVIFFHDVSENGSFDIIKEADRMLQPNGLIIATFGKDDYESTQADYWIMQELVAKGYESATVDLPDDYPEPSDASRASKALIAWRVGTSSPFLNTPRAIDGSVYGGDPTGLGDFVKTVRFYLVPLLIPAGIAAAIWAQKHCIQVKATESAIAGGWEMVLAYLALQLGVLLMAPAPNHPLRKSIGLSKQDRKRLDQALNQSGVEATDMQILLHALRLGIEIGSIEGASVQTLQDVIGAFDMPDHASRGTISTYALINRQLVAQKNEMPELSDQFEMTGRHNIAISLWQRGETEAAKAELLESQRNTHLKPLSIATRLQFWQALGTIYSELHDYEAAEATFQIGITFAERLLAGQLPDAPDQKILPEEEAPIQDPANAVHGDYQAILETKHQALLSARKHVRAERDASSTQAGHTSGDSPETLLQQAAVLLEKDDEASYRKVVHLSELILEGMQNRPDDAQRGQMETLTCRFKALAYWNLGQPNDAKTWVLRAIDRSKAIPVIADIRIGNLLLASQLYDEPQSREALGYLDRARDILEDLLGEDPVRPEGEGRAINDGDWEALSTRLGTRYAQLGPFLENQRRDLSTIEKEILDRVYEAHKDDSIPEGEQSPLDLRFHLYRSNKILSADQFTGNDIRIALQDAKRVMNRAHEFPRRETHYAAVPRLNLGVGMAQLRMWAEAIEFLQMARAVAHNKPAAVEVRFRIARSLAAALFENGQIDACIEVCRDALSVIEGLTARPPRLSDSEDWLFPFEEQNILVNPKDPDRGRFIAMFGDHRSVLQGIQHKAEARQKADRGGAERTREKNAMEAAYAAYDAGKFADIDAQVASVKNSPEVKMLRDMARVRADFAQPGDSGMSSLLVKVLIELAPAVIPSTAGPIKSFSRQPDRFVATLVRILMTTRSTWTATLKSPSRTSRFLSDLIIEFAARHQRANELSAARDTLEMARAIDPRQSERLDGLVAQIGALEDRERQRVERAARLEAWTAFREGRPAKAEQALDRGGNHMQVSLLLQLIEAERELNEGRVDDARRSTLQAMDTALQSVNLKAGSLPQAGDDPLAAGVKGLVQRRDAFKNDAEGKDKTLDAVRDVIIMAARVYRSGGRLDRALLAAETAKGLHPIVPSSLTQFEQHVRSEQRAAAEAAAAQRRQAEADQRAAAERARTRERVLRVSQPFEPWLSAHGLLTVAENPEQTSWDKSLEEYPSSRALLIRSILPRIFHDQPQINLDVAGDQILQNEATLDDFEAWAAHEREMKTIRQMVFDSLPFTLDVTPETDVLIIWLYNHQIDMLDAAVRAQYTSLPLLLTEFVLPRVLPNMHPGDRQIVVKQFQSGERPYEFLDSLLSVTRDAVANQMRGRVHPLSSTIADFFTRFKKPEELLKALGNLLKGPNAKTTVSLVIAAVLSASLVFADPVVGHMPHPGASLIGFGLTFTALSFLSYGLLSGVAMMAALVGKNRNAKPLTRHQEALKAASAILQQERFVLELTQINGKIDQAAKEIAEQGHPLEWMRDWLEEMKQKLYSDPLFNPDLPAIGASPLLTQDARRLFSLALRGYTPLFLEMQSKFLSYYSNPKERIYTLRHLRGYLREIRNSNTRFLTALQLPEPHQLMLPLPLRAFTQKKEKVSVQGQTLRQALLYAGEKYGMTPHLFTEEGKLWDVQVSINDEAIKQEDMPARLNAPLPPNAIISLTPSIPGDSQEGENPSAPVPVTRKLYEMPPRTLARLRAAA